MGIEHFPAHLELRKLAGYQWELLCDFSFYSPTWGWLSVPAGFRTDLASVPPIGRWYVSRDGDHIKPAILHDFGYGQACLEAPGPWQRMSRRAVDQLFLEAMEMRGVPAFKRHVIFAAVRLGGGRAFRDD